PQGEASEAGGPAATGRGRIRPPSPGVGGAEGSSEGTLPRSDPRGSLGHDGSGAGRGTDIARAGTDPDAPGRGRLLPGAAGPRSGGRSRPSLTPPGGGNLADPAAGPSPVRGPSGLESGSPLDGAGAGGANALPDLQPASDEAALPPLPA